MYYTVQNDTGIKFNIVLYITVISLGQGCGYKRPISGIGSQTRMDGPRLLDVLISTVMSRDFAVVAWRRLSVRGWASSDQRPLSRVMRIADYSSHPTTWPVTL